MAGERVEVVFDVNAAQFMRGVDAANAKVDGFGDRAKKGFEKFDLGASAVKRSLGSMGDALGASNAKAIKTLDAFADLGDMLSRGAMFGGIGAAIYGFTELNKYMEETEKKISAILSISDRAAERARASGAALGDVKLSAGVDIARAQIEAQITEAKARGNNEAARSLSLSLNELDASSKISAINRQFDAERLAMVAAQTKLIQEADDKNKAQAAVVNEIRGLETDRKNKLAAVGVELDTNNRKLAITLETERKLASDKSSPKSAAAVSDDVAARAFEIRMFNVESEMDAKEAAAEREKQIARDVEEYKRNLYLDQQSIRINQETAYLNRQIEIANATRAYWQNTTNDAAAAGIGIGIGAINALAVEAARGNEQAVQLATSQFLSGIGSQLVALGTQQIFQGLGLTAAAFGAPVGAPLVAIGGAAIATGIGMGAAGAAIAPRTTGASASGGRAASDRGVNTRNRTSRDSGGGGGVSIVINNGLGVTRERQSKDLRDLMAFTSRRAS